MFSIPFSYRLNTSVDNIIVKMNIIQFVVKYVCIDIRYLCKKTTINIQDKL